MPYQKLSAAGAARCRTALKMVCSNGSGARLCRAVLLAALCLPGVLAQHAYTWQELRDRFQTENPTLRAAKLAVDESRASETTAYLRPNPGMTATLDQIDPFSTNPYRPLGYTFPAVSLNYLHEREHKRELRRDSARGATAIA
jgi:cobalt-zinc-cadmium efflux system outer membrane protein